MWRSKANFKKYTADFSCSPKDIETSLMDELKANSNIIFCDPLGYIEFMSLVCGSRFVITDSGGVQEETTYLKIPCMTLRPNTERPVTVTRLCTVENTEAAIQEVLESAGNGSEVPKLWDGNAASRIVTEIRTIFCL